MASKQPRRSDLTSDLKSVTSITYISMCILLICFGPILKPFWWPQRPLQPPRSNLTSDLESMVQISYDTIFVWTVWASFGPFFELREKEERKKKEDELASTRPVGFAAGKKV